MINEHDIADLREELRDSLRENPPEDSTNMLDIIISRTASLLAQRCDNAWYYDAANLIRQTAGIPVSVTSDVQLSMKLHPEDDPE